MSPIRLRRGRSTWEAREPCEALNRHRFDAIRFRGPGTDLTVGLLPESRWGTGGDTTNWGRPFIANVPTEEVYTTPDWRRTQGVVRSTRPLSHPSNSTLIRELEVRFDGGRAVEVNASTGADVVRGEMAVDDGAAFLGEVALVTGDSRVADTGITFPTPCSTRTSPATSRTASRTPRVSKAEVAFTGRTEGARLQLLRRAYGLHGGWPRGRGRRNHRGRGRGPHHPGRRVAVGLS